MVKANGRVTLVNRPQRGYPNRLRRRVAWLTAVLLLTGCAAVGPNYAAPELAVPANWRGAAAAGAAVTETIPADLANWWRQLADPLLTGLIERALHGSPDLRAAQAKLREARARRALAEANRFPTVTAAAAARVAKDSAETGSGATRDSYSAGFDASWEPDVFGGLRRGEEAAQADLEVSAASLRDAQVSLAAEVALNYVELRLYQAGLDIARANVASQTETLNLVRWRAQAGLTSELDVEQARANLERTRAQMPSLDTSRVEAQHRLEILLGQQPGALADSLAAPAGIPAIPARVTVGIPADTLRQRPDVRAAERKLAAETARIGVAEAARYPSFSLSGSLGLEALSIGALAGGDAVARSLLGGVTAPIFDAGRIRQQVEIQSAVQEQALVNYETMVLNALAEVENALVALSNARQRRQSLQDATDAARLATRLARYRYAAGITDFQTVLDTERTVLTLEDSLKASEAQGVSALIQLYKALGGGWPSAAADPITAVAAGAAP